MSLKSAVIDLTLFQSSRMPQGRGAGFKQCLLSDMLDKPVYSCYYEAAAAMAEVTYSRLCHFLGIHCVTACYGRNFQPYHASINYSEYVSASEYHADWLTFVQGLEDRTLPPEFDEWKQHFGLGLLIMNRPWSDEGAGYVNENKQFAKANNGIAFFSYELKYLLQKDPTPRKMPVAPVTVSQFIEVTEGPLSAARGILKPMANLTDDQIDACIEMPSDWDMAPDGQSFLRTRLHVARDCAKRIYEAVMEDEEAVLEGL